MSLIGTIRKPRLNPPFALLGAIMATQNVLRPDAGECYEVVVAFRLQQLSATAAALTFQDVIGKTIPAPATVQLRSDNGRRRLPRAMDRQLHAVRRRRAGDGAWRAALRIQEQVGLHQMADNAPLRLLDVPAA